MKVNHVNPSTVYNNQYSTEKTKEVVTNSEEVTDKLKKIEDKVATTVKATSETDNESKNTGKNIDIYA